MSEINGFTSILAAILIGLVAMSLGAHLQSQRIGELCDKKIGFMAGDKMYECQERRP
jgi:hypothetical protein